MFRLHLATVLLVSALVRCAYGLNIDSVTVVEPASGGAVLKYGKAEVVVGLSGLISTKFYEPNPALGGVDLNATFTAPGGGNTKVNGYFDGASWRIRFSPTAVGNWTYSVAVVDSGGTANRTGGFLTCVASTYPGFAAIGGRYLQFSNGANCFAIGHNNGWQYDVEQPALASMAAQGENLLSFWMAAPWIIPSDNIPRTPIENAADGIGNYNQASCAYIDGVVARAETAGVYLLPSIWAHDQLCSGIPSGWPASWSNNAYSSVCAAGDFYTTGTGGDTAQWRYQQNFFRYMLARWGYSRAVAGWVAVVEMDGTTGYVQNPSQASIWAGKLKAYFAANDLYRVSGAATYPLAVSRVDAPTFDLGLGMRATDSYASKTNNIAVAQTIASQTAALRSGGQPALHTEFGGDVLNGASQPAFLHNGAWGGTAAGAAALPLLWCDGGNYPMLIDPNVGASMRSQLQYLSQFMSGIAYQGSTSLTTASLSFSSYALRGWGMRTSTQAFGWIQNSQGGTVNKQTLKISGLAAGKYKVAFYDVWQSGSVPVLTSAAITIKNGAQLSVTLPTLARGDVAWSAFPTP